MTDTLPPAFRARYTVERELGRGATSRVFLGRQTSLDRAVVIKVIDSMREGIRMRFQREAQLLTRLSHPRVVKLLDYSADEPAFLVTPFVNGRSLLAVARERGRYRWQEAGVLVRGVLEGLAHAHGSGIVHRDVKPANVIITEDGKPTLIDFGLAWADDVVRVTTPGMVVGTYPYIAPEQLRGAPPDPRSDLYACGVILLELLTGDNPFHGESVADIMSLHFTHQVRALPPLDPPAPEPLEKLVVKLLEKDPGKRPSSADAALKMLDVVLAQRKTRPVAAPPKAREVRRRSLAPAALGALALGAITALALVGTRTPEKKKVVAVPAPAVSPSPSATPPPARPPSGPAVGLLDLEAIATDRRVFLRARTLVPVKLRIDTTVNGRPAGVFEEPARATWHRIALDVRAGLPHRLAIEASEPRVPILPATLDVKPPGGAEMLKLENQLATDLPMAREIKQAFQAELGAEWRSARAQGALRGAADARNPVLWTPAGTRAMLALLDGPRRPHDAYRAAARAGGSAIDADTPEGKTLVNKLIAFLDGALAEQFEDQIPGLFRVCPEVGRALCEIGTPEALEAVGRFAVDGCMKWYERDPTVRDAVPEYRWRVLRDLARLHPDAARAVAARFARRKAPGDEVGALSIETNLPGAAPAAIGAALAHEWAAVRLDAMRSLRDAAPEAQLPEALAAWARSGERDAATIAVGAEALGLVRSGAAGEALEALADSVEKQLAEEKDRGDLVCSLAFVVHALARQPDCSEHPRVRAALASPHAPVKRAALRALAEVALRSTARGLTPAPPPAAADANPRTDLTGDALLARTLSGDPQAVARCGTSMAAGTSFQRWVASTCLALARSPLPDQMPFAPVAGRLSALEIRDGVAPAWRALPRVLRAPRQNVFLLDPCGPALNTGLSVTTGTTVTLEYAGMGAIRERGAREHPALAIDADTTQELVTPPADLCVDAQVGSFCYRAGAIPTPDGIVLADRRIALDRGTLVLRARYSFHTAPGGMIDARALVHPGVMLVRVTVAAR